MNNCYTAENWCNRAMGESFSVKSVLPAIFSDDPELDYHNRHNLLKYCKLDTYAMVKVWEELVKVTK